MFALLLMAWPIVMFVVSQALNINMFVMAFHDYTFGVNNPKFVGFGNFLGVFRLFDGAKVSNEWGAVRNSLAVGGITLFVNAPLSLAFAYLLYLKTRGYKFIRTVLYFPCITSAVVLVLIFKSFFMSGPIDAIYSFLGIYDKLPNEGWFGEHTAWNTIQIFNVWTGFSANMLFFLSAMNRVSDDYVEAAKLDGATQPKIFFKIILPLISPTVCTMLTISLAAVFTWNMPSLLIMGNDSGMYHTGTLGLSVLHWTSAKAFGTAAAYGVLLTLIGAPVTLGIRALTRKLETNVEY